MSDSSVITRDEGDVVFISYRRSDQQAVQALVSALQESEIRVWIDVADIRPATDWMKEILGGITNARAVVVLLSPDYLQSPVCLEEMEYARLHGKAIVPVVVAPLELDAAPAWLRALHWIAWPAGTNPAAACAAIVGAVSSDPQWADFHSHLLARAQDWLARGRPASMLLRGRELEDAEHETSRVRSPGQPVTTQLQSDFVSAGRAQQRRTTRTLIGTAVVVTVLSLVLASVAVWQRQKATASAREAQTALALSDFQNFSTAAAATSGVASRSRLALAAFAAASPADLGSTAGPNALAAALGATDLPVAEFPIRAESQQSTGDHLGVGVSGDGSTLAYLSLTGTLRVVDLWTLDLRAEIDVSDLDYQNLSQVAVSFGGDQVLLAVPSFDGDGDVRIVDVSADEPAVTTDAKLPLGPELAAASFGPRDGVYVFVRTTGEILIAEGSDDMRVTDVLGTPVLRTAAGAMGVVFSRDGNRACLSGEGSGLFQVSPPALLSEFTDMTCSPESCAGDAANHVEYDDAGPNCVAPNGAIIGPLDDCEACTRGTDSVTVAGPFGDRLVSFVGGLLRILDRDPLYLPQTRIALPADGGTILSSPGQPLAIMNAGGDIAFPEGGSVAGTSPAAAELADLVDLSSDVPKHLLTDGGVAWRQDRSLLVMRSGETTPAEVVEDFDVASWFGDLIAISTGPQIEITNLVTGDQWWALSAPDDVCELGWSLGGRAIAAVLCESADDPAAISTWRLDDGAAVPVEQQSNPLPRVGAITVSDDGSRFAVTQTSGQTVVWNGSDWVQTAALQSEATQTNGYQLGWSMLDSTGTRLLVRKNAEGLGLWAVDDSVELITLLRRPDPLETPSVVAFDQAVLRLAWSQVDGSTSFEPAIIRWSFADDDLVEAACRFGAATSVELSPAERAAAERYDDPCSQREPSLGSPPDVSPAPVETAAPAATDSFRLSDLQSITLAVDARPVTIASSGSSIVDVVGAQDVVIDLETMEVIRSEWLTDGEPVGSAAMDPTSLDLYVAMFCSDVFRRPIGGVPELVRADDGSGLTVCEDLASTDGAVWTTTLAGGAHLEGITTDGERRKIPLPVADAIDIVSLTAGIAGRIWAIVDSGTDALDHIVAVDPSTEVVTVVDVPNATGPLATDESGAVWFATAEGLSVIPVSGSARDIQLTDAGPIRSMVVDSVGRLWFVTDTGAGVVNADDSIDFQPIVGAERLGSLVFSSMDGLFGALDRATGTVYRFTASAA